MNANTIIPLFLLLFSPAITSIADAEDVVAVQDKPDLDNSETLEKILAEAVLRDTLEERGPEGAKLFYAPDNQTPYTGWSKRRYDNFKLKTLAHCRGGKPDGPYAEWHANGQKASECTFKDGKMEGAVTDWHENGQRAKEGTFKNGKQEGPGTMWHKNGRMAEEATFKDGKMDGLATSWHENGKKAAEVTFKDGKLEGSYSEWHENGQKSKECTYKDGKLEGPYTGWHANGQKAKQDTYKDGKKEGLSSLWHENAQKAGEANFKNGTLEGSYIRWHENGQKKEKGQYKEGKLEGLATTWDENGGVLRQEHYKNGKTVLENEPDLDDAETLKKTLGTALNWDVLKKDEQTGLYHNPDTRKPYTGWVRKLHGNGNVALLGALKDGRPAGLWTWWDENGHKEHERRQSTTTPLRPTN